MCLERGLNELHDFILNRNPPNHAILIIMHCVARQTMLAPTVTSSYIGIFGANFLHKPHRSTNCVS